MTILVENQEFRVEREDVVLIIDQEDDTLYLPVQDEEALLRLTLLLLQALPRHLRARVGGIT